MSQSEPHDVVRQHLHGFFAGHEFSEHQWPLGPATEAFPRLRIAEITPGPVIGFWVYATIGAFEVHDAPRLEFVIIAPEADQRHVEVLTMVAWYHARQCLGTGHTLPIGEPWLPKSTCDHLLVSSPYPFGPGLEICNVEDWHLHYLWVLPIASSERDFKAREGLEALEQLFEEYAIEFWNPNRPSVV